MKLLSKTIRYMSEKNTSVEDDVLYFQHGKIASKINTAYSFIPCGIEVPSSFELAPFVNGSVSANATAFASMYDVVSYDTLSSVSDLDAYANSVAYNVGTVVRATESGGTESAYICNTAYTSATSIDNNIANWTKLTETSFLKITHTAAGAAKVANFSFTISGYRE